MTANTFGIHQFTVSKTIVEVCDAMNTNLGPKYLHLPKDQDEMDRKWNDTGIWLYRWNSCAT